MDGIRVWHHELAYVGFNAAGIGRVGLGRGDMSPLSKMAANIRNSGYPFMSFCSGLRYWCTELSNALSFPWFSPFPTRQWNRGRLEKGCLLPWLCSRASSEFGCRLKVLLQNAKTKSNANTLVSDPKSVERGCISSSRQATSSSARFIPTDRSGQLGEQKGTKCAWNLAQLYVSLSPKKRATIADFVPRSSIF